MTTPFTRLALVVGRFRDMEADQTIAAVAIANGTARLTYGDLAELARSLGDTGDRLSRISTWHSRESGPAGMVGDFCNDCGNRWPCDTRRMADGTYEDDDDG